MNYCSIYLFFCSALTLLFYLLFHFLLRFEEEEKKINFCRLFERQIPTCRQATRQCRALYWCYTLEKNLLICHLIFKYLLILHIFQKRVVKFANFLVIFLKPFSICGKFNQYSVFFISFSLLFQPPTSFTPLHGCRQV